MIVVDTHALLWWIAHPTELSPAAHAAIIASDQLGVAAISVWEIAFLTQRGRILRNADLENWFVELFELPGTALLPITPSIAIRAASLEQLRDPADSLIVATALEHHAPLVTKDARIRDANVVDTIW